MHHYLLLLFALLALPAAAAEVPAVDGWVVTSGFNGGVQDSVDHAELHRAWSPKATPPVLEAGAGVTLGMRGAHAIYLKGNAFLQTPPSGNPLLLAYTKYGGLERRIPMEAWRGKRVRISLRTRDDGARAWITSQWGNSINPLMLAKSPVSVRAVAARPGADGWKTHQLVFDVPAGTTATLTIAMGIIGEGAAWLDDLRIEAVGDDMPKPPRCSGAALCWQTAAES